MYFSKKNMVCFVRIPKQSYIKVFQSMFIVFCTRIYIEMNNLRVYKLGHQQLRCYIPNQKDPGSNPHQQDINQKVFPGAVSSKLGNSKIHKKNNGLFEIKKFLVQIIILWKVWHHQETLVSAAQVPTCYHSVTLGQKYGLCKSHSLNSIQNIREVLTVFQFMPTFYQDHESLGKSTIIFIQTFIKTFVILCHLM